MDDFIVVVVVVVVGFGVLDSGFLGLLLVVKVGWGERFLSLIFRVFERAALLRLNAPHCCFWGTLASSNLSFFPFGFITTHL